MERAQLGTPTRGRCSIRRAYPRLFAYARRRLATDEQAEEAVSETMVRAMDKVAGYQPGMAGIDGWFFGIARNVVLETSRAGATGRVSAGSMPAVDGVLMRCRFNAATLRADVREIAVADPEGNDVLLAELPVVEA